MIVPEALFKQFEVFTIESIVGQIYVKELFITLEALFQILHRISLSSILLNFCCLKALRL
jgi:hypothetical protein